MDEGFSRELSIEDFKGFLLGAWLVTTYVKKKKKDLKHSFPVYVDFPCIYADVPHQSL